MKLDNNAIDARVFSRMVFGFSCLLALSACGSSPPGASDTNAEPNVAAATSFEQEVVGQEVQFDFRLSGLLESKGFAQHDYTIKANSPELMTGSMVVENVDLGVTDTYAWTINLDEGDLQSVTSLKTLSLAPGNYIFWLSVEKAGNRYVGSVLHNVIDGDTTPVPMTIRPVIGDSQVNTVFTELVDFKFQYSPTEFVDGGVTDPSIGISIDGGPESVFQLDAASGFSEYMYLDLSPGNYNIVLRLLDGNVQVGKSVASQETAVSVQAGLDISMDIIPLYGEVGMSLAVDGGDGVFNIRVPKEVVEEAGDLTNLKTVFTVSGGGNAAQTNELTFTHDTAQDDYYTSITLNNLYFGTVYYYLEFSKLSEAESIGYCLENGPLSVAAAQIGCNITVKRNSVVSGNLLSAVGVNVLDIYADPIAGAIVSVDGVDVAITNSASYSTPGYSKIYLKPGDHSIVATSGATFGEVLYTAVPLKVDNIDVTLDQ